VVKGPVVKGPVVKGPVAKGTVAKGTVVKDPTAPAVPVFTPGRQSLALPARAGRQFSLPRRSGAR
jgi:hypothetical protein